MSQKAKYPALIIREGNGTFSNGNKKYVALFELVHYPEQTIINVRMNFFEEMIAWEFATIRQNWTLDGKLEGDCKISVKNLFITKIQDNNLTFAVPSEVKIGEMSEDKFQYAEFPLVGFYQGQIDLHHNDWHIYINSVTRNRDLVEINSKNWNIQFEGLTLSIENEGASTEEYIQITNDITLLLSLAVGNHIIFNRQLYFFEHELKLEVWRRKTGYSFGAEPCIAYHDINDFLKQTIGNFSCWDKNKKDTYFTIIDYINSSYSGHLEDRILRLCIAWENLANQWMGKNTTNKELKPLKMHLKEAIKGFELPEGHNKDFIINRVSQALDWEKLYNSLTGLLNQYNLDNDKLDLDFKKLITIRNDIAHTGQFSRKYPVEDLTNLIFNNKLGLQVLLLRELGYDKFIQTHREKWKRRVDIGEFLLSS